MPAPPLESDPPMHNTLTGCILYTASGKKSFRQYLTTRRLPELMCIVAGELTMTLLMPRGLLISSASLSREYLKLYSDTPTDLEPQANRETVCPDAFSKDVSFSTIKVS